MVVLSFTMFFFFFKQKTAYEMAQCDWSSDVCSSDLRAAADACDVAETCTGSSSTCPADGLAASGTVCRAAVNECDLADTCTGTSISCPADAVQPAGTACTDDGNVCSSDVCNGTAGAPACTHPAGNAGAVCR